MDDKTKKNINQLVDAAKKHVREHGVVDKKTGNTMKHGQVVSPKKPNLILPGLPKHGADGRTALVVGRNNTNDRVRIQIIVQGHITGEAIMNAQTFEQFIVECQKHLTHMKEGPKGGTDVLKS